MLELRDLEVCYGSISALQGVSAKVERGNIVTLVGANGAGKTTTLRTISGVVKARAGKIVFDGEEITNLAPHKIVARGIAQAPEGRMIFANLTVYGKSSHGRLPSTRHEGYRHRSRIRLRDFPSP